MTTHPRPGARALTEVSAALRGRTVGVEVSVETPQEPLSAGVLLQHGFARGPAVLDALSALLAAHGFVVVRPWIRSFGRRRGMTVPDHVRDVAEAAIGLAPEVGTWTVVGHSAGGAVAAASASGLLDAGHRVGALVLVDPNESLTPMLIPGAVAMAAAGGPGSVRVLAAEPGRCNRQGRGPDMIAAAVPDADLLRIVDGTHCEIEGEAADVVCRRLCGGPSDPQRTALLHALVLGACHAGRSGAPGWGTAEDAVSDGLAAGTLVRLG
jgi:pimeloyl-ACP methyl ester carboxylesterase